MAPAAAPGDYASKVSPYLPTGTWLLFQTVLHTFLPGNGDSEEASACAGNWHLRGGTIAWLAVMCFASCLLSWTDSAMVDGKVKYYFLFPGKSAANLPEGVDPWGWRDFFHGTASAATLATLGLLTPPVSTCLFKSMDPAIPRAVPAIVTALAIVLFGFFDNGRDGIGFNPLLSAAGLGTKTVAPDNEGADGDGKAGASGGGVSVTGGGHGHVAAGGQAARDAHPAHGACAVRRVSPAGGEKANSLVNKVGNLASKLEPSLPTGTWLTFSTVLSVILPTASKSYSGTEKALAIAWLAIMCVLCALLSLTDSVQRAGQQENTYVLVLPWGHIPSDVNLQAEGKSKFNYKDVCTIVLSVIPLAALGLLTPPALTALLPTIPSWIPRAVPPVLVGLAAVLFHWLDNGRDGMGFNRSAKLEQAAVKGKDNPPAETLKQSSDGAGQHAEVVKGE